VVDDRVARDAICERVEAVLDAQIAEVAVKAQQYLLGHVVCGVRVADPPADEAAEAFVQAGEELVSVRGARFYWHPQPAEAGSSSQHSAFSAGSQQITCITGLQQRVLGWFGAGAGGVCGWSSIDVPLVSRFNEADENDREWMQTGPLVSTDTGKA
jgi:hypothetical protein